MDFSKTKIHCSSIAAIMGASQKGLTDKQKIELADLQSREKPLTERQKEIVESHLRKRDYVPDLDLSDGCITTLIRQYAYLVYGKRQSAYSGVKGSVLKGTQFEEDGLQMVERVTGQEYARDKRLIENEFLSGKVDGFQGETVENAVKIIDIKASWDIQSFLQNFENGLPCDYEYQMHGYMAITGAQSADVSFTLLNTPQDMLLDEYRKVMRRMHLTYDDPEFIREKQVIDSYYCYDEMPEIEKICTFTVYRDEEKIEKIYKKVEECRKWFYNFHETLKNRHIPA